MGNTECFVEIEMTNISTNPTRASQTNLHGERIVKNITELLNEQKKKNAQNGKEKDWKNLILSTYAMTRILFSHSGLTSS